MNLLLIKNSRILVIASIIALLTACQGGNTQNGQLAAADSLNKDSIAQEVKEVIFPLPTPFEMTKMLNDMGANYVAKSMNPASKVDKYFTEKSKAINLGIYGADLCYAATYDRKEDVNAYLKSVKTLVDELGIGIDYSYLLSDEFKVKANNKDSLTKIITNTYVDTYVFLSQKSNPELSVMMVSGMWVELMYIASHISADTYNNTAIVQIVGKQRDSYNKLMKLLADHNKDADIKDIESKLLIIKPVYDQIDKGLTVDQYKQILKTIETVRSKFVS